MSIEELLQSELEHAAARIDAPSSRLEDVMARGGRRRAGRLVALAGTGVACLAVAVGVTALVAGSRAPVTPVATPTPTTIQPTAARGVVETVEGDIVVDGHGLAVRPAAGGAPQPIMEAHTLQLGGRPSFGPALSDGAGGFVYSVAEVTRSATGVSGHVLWVPAGETTPRIVAVEPLVGVGEVIGVVDGPDAREVVYTTAAGRTAVVRMAPLKRGAARTVAEGVHAVGASGRHIIATSHAGGCTQLRIFTTQATERPLSELPGTTCKDIRGTVLSPDGTGAAFLDFTGGEATLTVIDATSGKPVAEWTVGEGRLVDFDGEYAYLDGRRRVAIATGVVESNSSAPGDVFQINDRLVLQAPGNASVSYEEAAGAAPQRTSEDTTSTGGTGGDWRVLVRSQSVDPPVDLDVFGVTTTGLGPYVLGARVQAVADASGHDLLAPEGGIGYCGTVAPGRAAAVSRGDLTVTVVNDRVVRFDFSTPRFTFDGLGVGSSIDDIIRRYPAAEVVPVDTVFDRERVTLSPVDDDGIEVVFEVAGDMVTRYRVGIPRHLEPPVPCR